MPVDKG